MNRNSCIALLMAAGVLFSGLMNVAHADETSEQLIAEANEAIAVAEAAVEEARAAVENGKQLIVNIPADSILIGEVREMLQAASENWILAVAALEGAKESASKIGTASSPEIAEDYKLLATVNSGVALSGAKVVQVGLMFVEAAAENKTEALDIIRLAMQDARAAASQVQFNYERVKTLIAEKYTK
jgi:hypothetical protein